MALRFPRQAAAQFRLRDPGPVLDFQAVDQRVGGGAGQIDRAQLVLAGPRRRSGLGIQTCRDGGRPSRSAAANPSSCRIRRCTALLHGLSLPGVGAAAVGPMGWPEPLASGAPLQQHIAPGIEDEHREGTVQPPLPVVAGGFVQIAQFPVPGIDQNQRFVVGRDDLGPGWRCEPVAQLRRRPMERSGILALSLRLGWLSGGVNMGAA